MIHLHHTVEIPEPFVLPSGLQATSREEMDVETAAESHVSSVTVAVYLVLDEICRVEVNKVSDGVLLAGKCWSAGSPGSLAQSRLTSQAERVRSLPCLLPQPQSVQARQGPVPQSPQFLPRHEASSNTVVIRVREIVKVLNRGELIAWQQ